MPREQHIPGPWRYWTYGNGSGRRFCVETSDGKHGLASIIPNENASTLLTMGQHQANAKLMAAAPALLESLKALVSTFNPDRQRSYEFARPLIEQAVAAIDNAEMH